MAKHITLETAMSSVPDIVREIAEVIGLTASLSLVDAAFARARANGSAATAKRSWRCFIYIPSTKLPSWIVTEKAKLLRNTFGNCIIELYTCGNLVRDLREEITADLQERGCQLPIVQRVLGRKELGLQGSGLHAG